MRVWLHIVCEYVTVKQIAWEGRQMDGELMHFRWTLQWQPDKPEGNGCKRHGINHNHDTHISITEKMWELPVDKWKSIY